jgi:TM2 domain-containing membrane protein YozV|tara:strand:- start:999 stop:1421 length:423 start_codon:yes stop_codon:yes gene_type:complete
MPPHVDPTSGVPVMDQPVSQNPQPQVHQTAMPQQTIQQQYGLAPRSMEPQMMNTVNGVQMVYPHMQKSRLVVLLFAILLGIFGAHNFYLGFTGKAVAQLLITLLTFGILAFIPAIWALIEGIIMFADKNAVDANGIPLKD